MNEGAQARMMIDALGEGLDMLGRFFEQGGYIPLDCGDIPPPTREEAREMRREEIRAKLAAIRAAKAAVGGDPALLDARPDEDYLDWIVRLVDQHNQRYTVMVAMSFAGCVEITRIYDLP